MKILQYFIMANIVPTSNYNTPLFCYVWHRKWLVHQSKKALARARRGTRKQTSLQNAKETRTFVYSANKVVNNTSTLGQLINSIHISKLINTNTKSAQSLW